MAVTKTGKKKLFIMTQKRGILLHDIISSVSIRLDSVDEDGLGRMFVLHSERISEEKRKESLMKLDTELQELCLLHDVLETVACHERDWLLNTHMKVQRGWRNEWDIPTDIFNESIDKVILILRHFQERGRPERRKKYDEKVAFLLLLKEFRNLEG